jgi:hypothetical protein
MWYTWWWLIKAETCCQGACAINTRGIWLRMRYCQFIVFMWLCIASGRASWPMSVTVTINQYGQSHSNLHSIQKAVTLAVALRDRTHERRNVRHVCASWRCCSEMTSHFTSPVLISGLSFREETWGMTGSVASSVNRPRTYVEVEVRTRDQTSPL